MNKNISAFFLRSILSIYDNLFFFFFSSCVSWDADITLKQGQGTQASLPTPSLPCPSQPSLPTPILPIPSPSQSNQGEAALAPCPPLYLLLVKDHPGTTRTPQALSLWGQMFYPPVTLSSAWQESHALSPSLWLYHPPPILPLVSLFPLSFYLICSTSLSRHYSQALLPTPCSIWFRDN